MNMTKTTTTAAVWTTLWADAKYLRLQARKDRAIKAYVLATSYRTTGYEGLVKKLDATAKRACRALQKYEDAALAAAKAVAA